ncbi:MAG: aminoglycoside phosphotransferase family protein [Alphaproteobacteria bacterium]|nr:aminoglycoside phosphotransferase family protein [Alphaproteobacteria bacterium]
MFKDRWEKESRLPPRQNTIKALMDRLCPSQTLELFTLLHGGLSHWHYKVILDSEVYVLRLHDRNDIKAPMEAALARKISPFIPAPRVLKTLYIAPYWCSLLTFEEGITLRTLLLNPAEQKNLYDLSYQAGQLLLMLQNMPYASSGFFDESAALSTPFTPKDLLEHAHLCLESDAVKTLLPLKLQDHLNCLFKEGERLLHVTQTPCLVHGDFDPSNMFVRVEKDKWIITSLIDWEYAHAGTYLQDAANWLRWRHHMPLEYMAGFSDALQEKGLLSTDADWQTASFLDALALLDLLKRTRPHQPIRTASLCALIEERLQDL